MSERTAAARMDYREVADFVVENEDTATAANALRTAADEIELAVAALREIERWPAPIDGSKVRAVASAALGKLL